MVGVGARLALPAKGTVCVTLAVVMAVAEAELETLTTDEAETGNGLAAVGGSTGV